MQPITKTAKVFFPSFQTKKLLFVVVCLWGNLIVVSPHVMFLMRHWFVEVVTTLCLQYTCVIPLNRLNLSEVAVALYVLLLTFLFLPWVNATLLMFSVRRRLTWDATSLHPTVLKHNTLLALKQERRIPGLCAFTALVDGEVRQCEPCLPLLLRAAVCMHYSMRRWEAELISMVTGWMTGHVSEDAMENCQFAAKPIYSIYSTLRFYGSARASLWYVFDGSCSGSLMCFFVCFQSVSNMHVGSRVKRADVVCSLSSG